MNKVLEGMANTLHSFWVRKACEKKPWLKGKDGGILPEDIEGQRITLLWLANNVSDEMVRAAIENKAWDDEQKFQPLGDLIDFSGENKTRTVVRSALSAALRAAAGGGE